MSYEPSHRKPPRQERWPSATPGEGWPAYQLGDDGRAWEPADAFAGSRNGYGNAGDGYGAAGNGYRDAGNGYRDAGNGYGAAGNGYGNAWGGRAPTGRGYGGSGGGARYGDPRQGYRADGNGHGGTTTAYPAAGDGYAGDGYAGAGYADGFDGAADGYGGGYRDATGGYGAVDQYGTADGYGGGYRDATSGYGPPNQYGTADGYGAADQYGTADGYGVAVDDYEAHNGWDDYAQPGHEFTGSGGYLAQDEHHAFDPASSALVAPDTMGEWWRQADRGDEGDRDPGERGPLVGAVTGLLAAAVAIGVATLAAALLRPQASPVSVVGGVLIGRLPATLRIHLTAHFGAHAQTVLLLGVIGLVAMVSGCAARRNASLGVACIAAFGLLGAFVAITRPESRASDVVPWAIGALAGILALLWLAWASAPTPAVAPSRPADGGSRRRAR
jgi:hypothetical protein